MTDEDVKLTKKQNEAFSLITAGKNVFITGPSGTGKSLVIKLFRKLYGREKTIAITSTTGISALLLGGTTLHSYLGIGLGTGSVEALTAKILKIPYLRERWKRLDVLIIDEISMLSPELFDKIEAIGRAVRSKGRLLAKDEQKPFGGIQLVLSGDFLQLPVVKSDDFCFEAESWNKCVDHTVYLSKIIRQEDKEFQTVLNDLRYGNVTKRAKKLLMTRVGVELKNDLGIKPTVIHTTNAAVDEINEEELDKLVEADPELEFFQYNMEIYLYEFVKNREYVIDKYRKSCIAPDVLQLCVGAQVMLLCNLDLDAGLANGSRGVITNFIEERPVVRFLNGLERVIDYNVWEVEQDDKKLMKMTQIPLKVAYAITTHKSQGCTLDYAEVDLSNVFTWGIVYVALSRVKTLQGLSILSIDFESVQAHPKAIEFYKKL
uniref:AAA+ ATPase domain-containing protein n=1 Tax=viral metagenome TaxID=1070528 RepID=A0A6C0EM76_9ZZZZ